MSPPPGPRSDGKPEKDEPPPPYDMLEKLTITLLYFLASRAGTGAEPLEPAAEGECPRLIQIKYPFLSCADGQIGQSDENETWENSRQLPQQGSWNEGDGAWGPDQNQN